MAEVYGRWMWLVGAIAVVAWQSPAAAQSCFGDCDGDGSVTVREMQTAVAISLGEQPLTTCVSLDPDGNGLVRVDDLTHMIADQLDGCAPPDPVSRAVGDGPVVVHVGSAAGGPGDTVSFDVTLEAPAVSVAGVQVDISFDPNTPVAAAGSGQPDCAVNPAIHKSATAFAFQPPGCTPGFSCTGFRSVVLSLSNVEPIPDGALMFNCNVAIQPSAPGGSYPLVSFNAFASDPAGTSLSTGATDGEIDVGSFPTPTISSTPTIGSPTATGVTTATATRTSHTATATRTPTATAVVPPAPGSLILRKARLHADDRPGRRRGSMRIDGVVNINPPFGGLFDDIMANGMRMRVSTNAGSSIELPWKPIACVARDLSGSPFVTCTAEDVLGWRKISFRPTGTPNLVAVRLKTRNLELVAPLTAEPVQVLLASSSFLRADDLGGCRIRGHATLKLCHESGILPSPTVTATATATGTRTGTRTATVTPTRTITKTPTATFTRTSSRTPTMTFTPTQIVVPTVALGERVFTIEPGTPFASPFATRTGLFNSLAGGVNVATSFSSGPLTLVGGLPDASGVAPLSLKEDVTLLATLTDGSYACFKLFATGSTGSIDCNGGTAYDITASQPAGDVGFLSDLQTHQGSPAGPGHADLVIMEQGQFLPAGPVPDCSTITYENPPQPFGYTTATAIAVKGAQQLFDVGEPFSCAAFSTPRSGGMLATPVPLSFPGFGDMENVFRFAEESPCALNAGRYTIAQGAGGSLRLATFSEFPLPAGGSLVQDVGPGDANCVHETVIPFPGGFTQPAFCIPALGFTMGMVQTACGVGQIDSDGGSDFTITEAGDSSEAALCGVAQGFCPASGGPAPDSSGRIDITTGNGLTDACASGGTMNLIGTVPVHTTMWLDFDGSCPDLDGTFDPGFDTAVASFDQTLDFTTDSVTAAFADLDGDGCAKSGIGPLGGFARTGRCLDEVSSALTTVSAGVIFSSVAPLYDVAFAATLPGTLGSPDPLGNASCATPPAHNFAGLQTRCIVAP